MSKVRLKTRLGKTAVVWSCAHANPKVDNRRFEWLGNLIFDIQPDYTIDLGDLADMSSLNSYDTRYPQAIVSQSYQEDIETVLDAQEKLWSKFTARRVRRPYRFGFEGNHEHRIKKAVQLDPRLEGDKYGVSFSHLQTKKHYDRYFHYENSAPAIATIDGVSYSHFFSSGNYGTAISGVHHGYALTTKLASSATCGHSHKRSYFAKQEAVPNPIHGLVVGCMKGEDEAWAGQSNREWWKGCVIKRNIREGNYDLQFVSMEALERDYS